jgi:dethiobiotin synthetase
VVECYDAVASMRIVIVGTGTHIGKTHLGVTLIAAAARRGWSVCGLKPVESGVPAGQLGEDAAALAATSTFHVKHPQPYALPDPVSPHLAARRTGVTIVLEHIQHWVDEHSAPWLFIETAGALLSPLSKDLTNLDLCTALTPDRWILVSVDRLGVLHDVSACLRVLTTKLSTPPLVILQPPITPDTSTGTNADELRALEITPIVFTFPRSPPLSPECQSVAGQVLDHLQATTTEH